MQATGAPLSASRTARWGVPALAAALALVLVATLRPGAQPAGSERCLWCGDQWVADALANVALFVPLGVALALARVRGPAAWLVPVLLSAAVELLQLSFIPGRDGSLADIVTNGLGGCAGYILAVRSGQWARPANPRRVAGAAAAAVLLIVALTAVMARPSLPRSIWWGQWTPRFAYVDAYRGRVVEASLGPEPIPSSRLEHSPLVRDRLLAGDTLRIRVVAGLAPTRPAPIFSIADDALRTILLVGAQGPDAELRVRRLAARLRLVQPVVRFDRALARVAAGEPASLTVRRAAPAWCLRVDAREWCGVGVGPGGGWRLLVGSSALSTRMVMVCDALWLAALMALAAFWARGREGLAISAAVLVLVCGVFPVLLGLDAATPLAWGSGALGIAAGLTAGNRVAPRTGNRLL